MEIIIDANVIAGYYQELVTGADPRLTDRTEPVFERVGMHDRVYLDEDGHIANEWQRMAEPEWFKHWYRYLLRSEAAVLIPVDGCNDLRKKLESYGFPKKNKDFWYVRTAKAVAKMYDEAILLTEDMDFYEPSKKKRLSGAQRDKILLCSGGQIANHLRKKERILVTCIAGHLNTAEDEYT